MEVELSCEGGGDPLHGLFHIGPGVEGGKPDIALAALAEARAWGTDHSGLFQQRIKKLPGISLALHPNVGCVLAARMGVAQPAHGPGNETRIGEVAVNQRTAFGLPLF